MLGASGAVGNETLTTLLEMDIASKITLLGRRTLKLPLHHYVKKEIIDIFNPQSYEDHLSEHDIAICTLGVGKPSKVSKEDFLKIDKIVVIEFAKLCKVAGIKHFELLASVRINSKSRSFYLSTKGELVEALRQLNFESLSIFNLP